jgi:hypothetical protein
MAVSNLGPPPLKVATYIFPWAKAGSPLFREFLLDPISNFKFERASQSSKFERASESQSLRGPLKV